MLIEESSRLVTLVTNGVIKSFFSDSEQNFSTSMRNKTTYSKTFTLV